MISSLQPPAGAADKRSRGSHGLMKPRLAGSLKAAVARTFEKLGPGFLAKVADKLGRKKSQVQRYADPDALDVHLRIDQLETLVRDGAGRDVVEHLAAHLGCVLVPVQAIEGNLLREYSRASEASARLSAQLTAALADPVSPGYVDDLEARELLLLNDRLIQQHGAVRASLLAIIEGAAP